MQHQVHEVEAQLFRERLAGLAASDALHFDGTNLKADANKIIQRHTFRQNIPA